MSTHNPNYYVRPRIVARTAATLQAYKLSHFAERTPMFSCYKENTAVDNDDVFLQYFFTARYMGWDVRRKGNGYYENEILVWTINGN